MSLVCSAHSQKHICSGRGASNTSDEPTADSAAHLQLFGRKTGQTGNQWGHNTGQIQIQAGMCSFAPVGLTNAVISDPSSGTVEKDVSSPVWVSVSSCAVSPQLKPHVKICCSSLKTTVCLKTNGIVVTRFSLNKPNLPGLGSRMLLLLL